MKIGRRTEEERAAHSKAVALRRKTDERLVEAFERRYTEGYQSGYSAGYKDARNGVVRKTRVTGTKD